MKNKIKKSKKPVKKLYGSKKAVKAALEKILKKYSKAIDKLAKL